MTPESFVKESYREQKRKVLDALPVLIGVLFVNKRQEYVEHE